MLWQVGIRQTPRRARRKCLASWAQSVLLMNESESDQLVYAMSTLLVLFALAVTVFLSYY